MQEHTTVPKTPADNIREAFFSCVEDALFQEEPHPEEAVDAATSFLVDLGFALDGSSRPAVGLFENPVTITQRMLRAGFGLEEIKQSKLIADGRLLGRLVGPIRDSEGRIVSFWARHPEGQRPRYLYLNGGWQRDVVAYGLDVVPSHVLQGQGNLLVLRDLMDALLLHSHGFPDVVAMGMGRVRLTTERWERLAGLGVRCVTLTLGHGEDALTDMLTELENAFRAKAAPDVFVLPQEKWLGTKWAADLVRREGPTALRELLERERIDGSHYVLHHLRINGHESPDHWQTGDDDTAAISDIRPSEPSASENEHDAQPQCPIHHCDETDCFCFD